MWLVLHAPVTTDLLKQRNLRHLPVPPRKALTTKAHREYELTQPDGVKSNERSGPNRGQIGLAQPRPPCSTVCWGKHDSLSTVDDWERAMDQSRDHSEADTLVVAQVQAGTHKLTPVRSHACQTRVSRSGKPGSRLDYQDLLVTPPSSTDARIPSGSVAA
jgi:hypothetical protein